MGCSKIGKDSYMPQWNREFLCKGFYEAFLLLLRRAVRMSKMGVRITGPALCGKAPGDRGFLYGNKTNHHMLKCLKNEKQNLENSFSYNHAAIFF
jgi:hypothetical protein